MAVKKKLLISTVVVLCAALAFLAWVMHNRPVSTVNANSFLPTTTLTIGSTTIVAEVASDNAQRAQGLSDRAMLLPGHGMLFVFQQETEPGFWMKDMNFALDMLFIDASGKIVTIDRDLSPSSYNHQDPQASAVFYPSAPVLYVLEVPAGFAAQHGIQEGMMMRFVQ